MTGSKSYRKKVRVRSHVKKSRTGRKIFIPEHNAYRTITVKPAERKLFNAASEAGVGKEYGGVIDVGEDGAIERFTTETGGKGDEIALPDYEALWHTHPDRVENPPSPEDIATLVRNKNQQAEIVFNDGRAMVVVKTPLTRKYRTMSEERLVGMFEKLFNTSMKDRDFYDSYARRLRGLGFIVKTSKNPRAALKFPLEVVD